MTSSIPKCFSLAVRIVSDFYFLICFSAFSNFSAVKLLVMLYFFLKIWAELWYALCSQGTKARKCFKYLNSVICRWPIALIMPTAACYFSISNNSASQQGLAWDCSKGRSSVPTPAYTPVSEATGYASHETKIVYGAKSEHHVFVPKSWHI